MDGALPPDSNLLMQIYILPLEAFFSMSHRTETR